VGAAPWRTRVLAGCFDLLAALTARLLIGVLELKVGAAVHFLCQFGAAALLGLPGAVLLACGMLTVFFHCSLLAGRFSLFPAPRCDSKTANVQCLPACVPSFMSR